MNARELTDINHRVNTQKIVKILPRSDPDTLYIPGSQVCSIGLSSEGVLRKRLYEKFHSEKNHLFSFTSVDLGFFPLI